MRDSAAIPVFVQGRHLRLSAPHAELLFGTETLPVLCRLSYGLDAAQATVDVMGPSERAFRQVRVLLPLRRSSAVYLGPRDLAASGHTHPTSTGGPPSTSCVLVGPRGSVVLTDGVATLQRVELPSTEIRGLRLPSVATIELSGERRRLIRRVPVVADEVRRAAYLPFEEGLEAAPTLASIVPESDGDTVPYGPTGSSRTKTV